MNHEYYLNFALKEAKKSYKKKEVPVGCVIVKNNKIIAKAHNIKEKKHNCLAHAEIIAIHKASKKLKSWRLDGCIMYVTLEPCLMCAGAIIQSRISELYFGAYDHKFGGCGSLINILELKNNHKLKHYEHLNNKESSTILLDFFKKLRY